MPLDPLNYFLDRITMYKLVLWFLRILFAISLVLGFFKIIPFSPIDQIFSFSIIWIACVLANKIFSIIFKAPTNSESVFITALILFFIITPSTEPKALILAGGAGVIAMASKYLLAINKKHIFNPAAFGVVFTGFLLNYPASWWVGNSTFLLLLLIGGFLIVKKTQRFSMVLTYLGITMLFVFLGPNSNINPFYIEAVIKNSLPFFIYFGTVMLVEPLTSPVRRKHQVIYGGFVALLSNFASVIPVSLPFYIFPEAALLIGNIFAYVVNPGYRLFLPLISKSKLAQDILNYEFSKPKNFHFLPGQYLEWTLPHKKMDFRGNRRYFTIASSPTEDKILLGVKNYENGSSFKRSLRDLEIGKTVVAGQLTGDFIIPSDDKKYVFIAGGIGITPFRSMLKYLLDKNKSFGSAQDKKLDITLFYSNKNALDIVYKDILGQAEKKLGIKTIYTLTDTENLPEDWKGKKGRISAEMIKEIPDYKKAIYYLSGPHALVSGFEKTLHGLGIPRSQIKKDFFPGYA